LGLFIDVADDCLNSRNFNSCLAIASSLTVYASTIAATTFSQSGLQEKWERLQDLKYSGTLFLSLSFFLSTSFFLSFFLYLLLFNLFSFCFLYFGFFRAARVSVFSLFQKFYRKHYRNVTLRLCWSYRTSCTC
jgi:hypothetical protein